MKPPKSQRRAWRARYGRQPKVDGTVVTWTQNTASYGYDTHRAGAVRDDGAWYLIGAAPGSGLALPHTWWQLCLHMECRGVTSAPTVYAPGDPVPERGQIADYPSRRPRPLYPAYGYETLHNDRIGAAP